MITVMTPEGSIELCSALQEHPAQLLCPHTDLWCMPLLSFPCFSPIPLLTAGE